MFDHHRERETSPVNEFRLKLPEREDGIATLNRMKPESRPTFDKALWGALWDAYMRNELPDTVVLAIQDGLTQVAFWESPVMMERLAEAEKIEALYDSSSMD